MKRTHFPFVFIYFLYCCTPLLVAQNSSNTIRGTITDVDSKYPIPGATIVIVDSDPLLGTATNPNGEFELKNVPIGRVVLRISAIGYETSFLNNIQLFSGKETVLNISLREEIGSLDEIVVTPGYRPDGVKNEYALVSAKTFDMELSSRFAGSRNDPARMATNFAGVSGANDARNDIIIRGNSPSGVLWRMEGIDIPSPNHFSSFGSTGGPVSMLNNNVLAQSDFMTAAFPAEYGNALAGVFDLEMRNGNSSKSELIGQIGFNGFEFGAEGPLSKKSGASYLINYRYSTLAVFEQAGFDFGTGGGVPFYQDVSYKVNVPTKNVGQFAFWGLAGNSNIEILGSELDLATETNLYGGEGEDIYSNASTSIFGFNHTYFINKNTFSKLSIAYTYQAESNEIDSVSILDRSIQTRYASINNNQGKWTAHWRINQKVNARNTLSAGIIGEQMSVAMNDSSLVGEQWFTIKEGKGNTQLAQLYANWQHRFNNQLTLNSGYQAQYFGLSNAFSAAPRFGLKYLINAKHELNAGLGIHYQTQPLPVYFTLNNDMQQNLPSNRELDFTRSVHLVAGHTWRPISNWSIKTEVYFQNISNAPTERFPSSFSMLNNGIEFGTPDESALVNGGVGQNYGIEFTIEKAFSNQSYVLATASIFESNYEGSDGIQRNTAFNGKYVFNVLAGKEWKIKANRSLVLDLKLTAAGGRYYTPIDVELSRIAGETVLNNNQAFSQQFADYFRTDIKIMYRVNVKNITQEIGLDLQNITNRQNEFLNTYNERTQEIAMQYQLGFFPIPQYRILF